MTAGPAKAAMAPWTLDRALAIAALDETVNAVFVTDADGVIQWVNRAFTELTGWAAEEAIGETPRIFQSGLHGRSYYEQLWKTIRAGKPFRSHVANRRPDGELYFASQSVTPICVDGKPAYFIAIQEDVTKLMEQQRELERLAYIDPLTGLGNRRAMYERVRELVAAGRVFALLIVDLNDFKAVNDCFGHTTGDELLRSVSRAIQRVATRGDAFRLGGDEFVVLHQGDQPLKDNALAARIAARSRKDAKRLVPDCAVTASIGFARYPQDATNGQDLLRFADLALYAAKSRGSVVAHYAPEMGARAIREQTLRQGLGIADFDREFSVAYQPIVDLSSGATTGFEALARWTHPTYGVIAPDEFIPLAERSGQVRGLGRWVLRRALEHLRSQADDHLRMNVNVAYAQLLQRGFVDEVMTTLDEFGVEPARLELELTESQEIDDERILGVIADLRDLGVGIAIDDFGTGYSSLSRLARLPITALKIDRSFVTELSGSERDQTVVRAVISTAQAIGQRVVAEGIETEEELAVLRNFGCDEGQGYLLGRPARVLAAGERQAA